jgi:ketosteroid isomerase-like protein
MARAIALGTTSVVAALVALTLEPAANQESAVARVLDDWHKAAAAADEERYFSHFTPDAVMMGTDATERWTRDQFREWAKPHFAKGEGWSFNASERYVSIAKGGSVAWFDEVLDTAELGPCRGSGVLLRDGEQWKIAQYNLSIPIPNEVFPEVKRIVEAALKAKPNQ